MASPTDIANRALQKIGATRIMSMDDTGKNAGECRACYEILRDAELRRHPWSFAMVRAGLPALDVTPSWGFDNAFGTPTDLLRLVEIDGASFWDATNYRSDSRPPFRIEDGQILTDLGAPLNIRYLKRETDSTRFDPCFVEVLACRMAAELAEPITSSLPKKQLVLGEYKDAIREAKRLDAIEAPPQEAPDDSWIMGRL
jgi:hypothetical protein